MSKRSKACDISPRVRQEVMERDKGCIFCQMGYHMPPTEDYLITMNQFEIMHFIPRSQGGLGIKENLAVGCKYHHMMLDNGRDTRDEMIALFECVLRRCYKDWNRKNLVYDKWSFLK